MPVERLTPERRRQLTREALIAAATEVFTKKGFHAASLDEIADAAGFTKGAIYSNFNSKEELLHAVIGHLRDTQLAGIADVMDAAAGDPVDNAEAVGDAWQRWISWWTDELLALSLELRLYALRNPDVRSRLATLEQEVSDKLAGFIEDEFARRHIKLGAPAREIADLGRAAIDGLEQMAALNPGHAGYYQHLTRWMFVLLASASIDTGENSVRTEVNSS